MLYTNQGRVEDGKADSSFLTVESRAGFIVRVYALLFVCLAATALQCFGAFQSDKIMIFFNNNWWIGIVCMIVYIVAYFSLVCCYCTRHIFPVNLLMLILLVEGMSGMCVYVTSHYRTEVVLYTFGLAAAICLVISLLAIFGPIDFTGCDFLIMVLGVVTVLMGVAVLITHFFARSHVLRVINSSVAVVFISVMMAYDTQLVLGGRHKDLEDNEFIYGAVTLYTDFMQIFIHMVSLVNECF